MPENTTVVFADLTGSTGAFESLGNERATRTVTELTTWIGSVCEADGGRVVKKMGDGVLAVFPYAHDAIKAVVELQRGHLQRLSTWSASLGMHLQVGVASGEVVVVDGDCYGDAVNVAARLSDLSGAGQIWMSGTVAEQLNDSQEGWRFISLGPISLRGRAEACVVHRVEWRDEAHAGPLTTPAALAQMSRASVASGSIQLSWLNQLSSFRSEQLPVHLGRSPEADFIVLDQRVSRVHVAIAWRDGSFVLTDMSSFGTWLRFDGSQSDLSLRREECVLHGNGVVALGAPFSDFTVPTVSFNMTGSSARG